MDTYARWQRLSAEFLGTASLVTVGVGSVPASELLLDRAGGEPFAVAELGIIALAFGTIVTATVYTFGYVSGNHINPAVTIGFAVTGKMSWKEVPGYIGAQTIGAIVGSLAIVGILGTEASDLGLGVASYSDETPVWQAFTAEFIGTFLLVATVFGVIHRKAAAGFAGLAIGAATFAIIIAVAPTTGAALNPARFTGPMLIQELLGRDVTWSQWPVYVIAEVLGGALAAGAMVAITKTDPGHHLHHWWHPNHDEIEFDSSIQGSDAVETGDCPGVSCDSPGQ